MNDTNYINVVSGLNTSIDNTMLEATTKDKIILYFGGGLSSNKYIREQLGPLLLETTFHPANIPNSHPVIVQWETSPFEIDSIESIAKEILGANNIEKIRNWLKRKLGIEAKGLIPYRPENEAAKELLLSAGFTEKEIESDDVITLSDGEIEFKMEQFISKDGDDVKESLQSIDENIMKNSSQKMIPLKTILVLYKILKRFVRQTDHGTYTTIVEELLRYAIIANSSLADLAQGHWKCVYETSAKMWTEKAGEYFLEKLNEHCKTNSNFRVDLVSHSAGSIAICHLIEEIAKQYPNIKIGNILPIAPAVRMKLFEDTIMKNHSVFENFRMFTLSDQAECEDKLFWHIYPHSLLYFVSGVAEEEGLADMSILGMHRYFSPDREPYNSPRYGNTTYREKFGDLQKIREYLSQEGKVVLSPNNVNPYLNPGFASDGTGHENTKLPNKSPELAKSIIYLLSKGMVKPSDVDTSNWQEICLKYHKC